MMEKQKAKPNHGSRVLYFVPERPALDDGVLHAQVLMPARYLMERGFKCLFVGTETSDDRAAKAEKLISEKYGVPALVCGLYSMRIPYVSSVWAALGLRSRSRQRVREFCPTHVYTRGYNAAVAARRVARDTGATLVFDVRGVASAETALRRGEGAIYRFILGRELSEIRKADRLTCVSHNLKDWIARQTGRTDVSIIPCCVDLSQFSYRDKARNEIRERYGVGAAEKLLCYCGGLARWQRVEDVVRLYAALAARRADYKFMFLCQGHEPLKPMIASAGLPLDRCILTGCAHEDVPSYLSAADAGVIMREDTTVNNVASPVKVAEYLACGLPVILTRGIGDYSKAVGNAGVGLLLDETGQMDQQVVQFLTECDRAAVREKAIAFARENVTWDVHLGTLLHLFDGEQNERCC